MAVRINRIGNFKFVGANYVGAMNAIWGNVQMILTNFLNDEGDDYLRAARLFNPSNKVRVTGGQISKEYAEIADGPGAAILAYGTQFTVPPGGFKPRGRAFILQKPGHFVFRSRTYNRQSGRTIFREGFFSMAIKSEIMSMKGLRRAQRMINSATYHAGSTLAQMIDAEVAPAGLEVVMHQDTPTPPSLSGF